MRLFRCKGAVVLIRSTHDIFFGRGGHSASTYTEAE